MPLSALRVTGAEAGERAAARRRRRTHKRHIDTLSDDDPVVT
jgi:hypothetical protein